MKAQFNVMLEKATIERLRISARLSGGSQVNIVGHAIEAYLHTMRDTQGPEFCAMVDRAMARHEGAEIIRAAGGDTP